MKRILLLVMAFMFIIPSISFANDNNKKIIHTMYDFPYILLIASISWWDYVVTEKHTISYDMNLQTYVHELKHIYYDDFKDGNIGNIERKQYSINNYRLLIWIVASSYKIIK